MAFTAGPVTRTELEGEFQIAFVDVPTNAAAGNITLADYGNVFVTEAKLNVAPVATCAFVHAHEDVTVRNRVNISLLNNTFGNATTFPSVRITFLGRGR